MKQQHSVTACARKCGLWVATWSPGDGQTRYRFFLTPSDYDAGDGIFTALGRAEALTWLNGFSAGARYYYASETARLAATD